MCDAERICGERVRTGALVAARGAVDVHLARPADPAHQTGGDHHRGAPVPPCEVMREAAPDDWAPVGDVQRGEPATSQLLPVVVIDPGRTELRAGNPEKLAVPRERGRFEVDADLPAHSADTAAIDRDEADAT